MLLLLLWTFNSHSIRDVFKRALQCCNASTDVKICTRMHRKMMEQHQSDDAYGGTLMMRV